MDRSKTYAPIVYMCALTAFACPTASRAQDAPLLNAEPTITWRVENPFRFFRSSAAADMHRRTLAELTPKERQAPILNVEKRLGRQFPFGWSEQVFRDTCWSAKTNGFERCERSASYFKPRSHRIIARLSTDRLNELRCTWLVTPRSGSRRPQIAKTNCGAVVELEIPYPNGATVSVTAQGSPVTEADIRVRDLFVLSLGDSFASGEGNPDRPVRFTGSRQAEYGELPSGLRLAGLPARAGRWNKVGDQAYRAADAAWLSRACHRSLYSHHLRAALDLAIEDPHRAVTFASFACAGAEIGKGLFHRFKGTTWTPNPPELSQLSAAAKAQCGNDAPQPTNFPNAFEMKGALPELSNVSLVQCPRNKARPIDLLFVSIGGNDIGFAGLVGNAIVSDASKLRQVGGWLGAILTAREADQKLRQLPVKYKALNRAFHTILRIPWNQSDRIILTAYPLLATRADQRSLCPDTRLGLDVFPEFALDAKRAKASTSIAAKLYRTQVRTARQFGWTFVDSHRSRFAGHSICSGNWGFESTIADDLRIPRLIDGEWRPYNPELYQPYAPRQRWFRTPNDAYMTANSQLKLGGKLLEFQRLRWFQLLFSATFSGAFHPNALGQAAMGDALAKQARAVITKYRAYEAQPSGGRRRTDR